MQADTQMPVAPPQDQIDLAVEVFRMLADPTRVILLWLLTSSELPVNELAAAAGRSQTSVSQHLAKLRMARLVQTRRQGNQIFYRIDSDHVRQLVVDAIHHAEHAGTDVPEHHRRRAAGKVAKLGESGR
jgi:ArsR family transcriptional regulator, zinc-responsive transcriptional repressor